MELQGNLEIIHVLEINPFLISIRKNSFDKLVFLPKKPYFGS